MRHRSATTLAALLAATVLALPVPGADNSAPDKESRDLLIRNVTVISLEREDPYGPVDVSIRDGRIAAIQESAATDAFQHDEIIDASDQFLLPGLIDSHVHLSTIPGMHGGHEAQYPEVAQAAREQIPLSYLYHGFTSVVDLISTSGYAEKWNSQEIRPRLYYCGAAPIMDGYPTQFTPKPDRYHASPNFLYDPTRADEFPEGFDPTDHSPEAVVSRIAKDGAIAVKVFWEDGFGNATNIPVPPEDVLTALVSAAHAHGLPVIAHANSENAQAACIAAGVDAFAHGLWTWDSPDAPELTAPIKSILDDIIEKGIGWQPSIQVLYGERDLFDPQYLTRPDVRAAVPASVLEWYATPDGQWLTDEMRAFPYVAELATNNRWQEIDALPIRHVTQALAYLNNNGGKLLFGSDTPSAPTYANPAGLNGRLEMDRWIQAGVSPRAILHAATIANAEFFNLSDDIGTIEVGKRADLLLLNDNPLDQIEAMDTIKLVIQEGRPFRRGRLAANRLSKTNTDLSPRTQDGQAKAAR